MVLGASAQLVVLVYVDISVHLAQYMLGLVNLFGTRLFAGLQIVWITSHSLFNLLKFALWHAL